MAEYNILPTRGPVLNNMQIGTENMLTTAGKLADREWEKKKWEAQQPNTIDKILNYAGKALDMYSKWEDIENKKLDQENKQLQQNLNTLRLEQAKIQAQTQNAQLEKDAKYASALSSAMESGDPNAVYSIMMRDLKTTQNNKELTASAVEFCRTHGMSDDQLSMIDIDMTEFARKESIKHQNKLEEQAARAAANSKTSEMTAQEKWNETTFKAGPEAIYTLMQNEDATMGSLVQSHMAPGQSIGSPQDVDAWSKKYKFTPVLTWRQDVENLMFADTEETQTSDTEPSLLQQQYDANTFADQFGDITEDKKSGANKYPIVGAYIATNRDDPTDRLYIPIKDSKTLKAMTSLSERSNAFNSWREPPTNSESQQAPSINEAPALSEVPTPSATPSATPYKTNNKDARLIADNLTKKYSDIDKSMGASVSNDPQALDSVIQEDLDNLRDSGYLRSFITPTLELILRGLPSKESSELRSYLKTMEPENQRAVGRIILEGMAHRETPKEILKDVKNFLKNYVTLSDEVTPSASPSVTPSDSPSVAPSETPSNTPPVPVM